MFLIINISSNLLETLSCFFSNNSKCYVTKNGKNSSRRKYHNLTPLKIDGIEKYYRIRKKEFNRKRQQQ